MRTTDIQLELKRNEHIWKAYSDREKMLMKCEKELERKERTRRLIERGAMVEKYLVSPLILSNEQVSEILVEAFSDERVKEIIRKNVEVAEKRATSEMDDGRCDEGKTD